MAQNRKKDSSTIISFIRKHKLIFLVTYFVYTVALVLTFFIDKNNSVPIYNESDISEKITIISNNLKETATELSILQQQLENRIEFVENLQKEAEIAEDFLSLSEEQVNAVQSKINQELNASSNKSTIMSFLISTLFFVLGLAVQPILNLFRGKKEQT